MKATVIDTLRYANRLKEAGVESLQAEAMSRAINDELTEGVVTKRDLDAAVAELKSETAIKFATVDARFDAMDVKFENMDAKFEGKIDALDAKFEGRIDALDAKFEGRIDALDAKFSAMFESLSARVGVQGRYTFLVLALIAALGFYNAVAPHVLNPHISPGAAMVAEDPVALPAAAPTTPATPDQ